MFILLVFQRFTTNNEAYGSEYNFKTFLTSSSLSKVSQKKSLASKAFSFGHSIINC